MTIIISHIFLRRGGPSAILEGARISRNYPYCYYKLIKFSSAIPQIFGTDLYIETLISYDIDFKDKVQNLMVNLEEVCLS